jgi:mitogen-activated protein kinase kinase
MLLQHAWLKPLVQPFAIMEEDEDEEALEAGNKEPSPTTTSPSSHLPTDVVDREVAEWVIQALEKKRLGKLRKSEKPALHAAPLDVVTSPVAERTFANGIMEQQGEVAVETPKVEEPKVEEPKVEESKLEEEPKPAPEPESIPEPEPEAAPAAPVEE